ncbi:Sulfide dehydrogenase [flavocytochrome C] flavoprotein chain precursor [invertebrate metagenome]|uniref:Sulfide dehydrogenase [flavocytochrome C] flavoprotein chain n=1 Tax=invertebrate metagenome TaxID=1711999 RepID=A0A484H4V1_9ZZZZ
MFNVNRRGFLKLTTAATLPVFGVPSIARGASQKVVVIGGGPGGATAAKYLKMASPQLNVTLIEASAEYIACFLSNEALIGRRTMDSLTVRFDGLKQHGINIVLDTVTGLDPASKRVSTREGKTYAYDRCVVAPGIDFRWDAIEGYNEMTSATIPHAWKAGAQTQLLRKQIESMKDGGTVIIVAPPNPFRCPPGPYERASLLAHYFKSHGKTKSKIIILDPKDDFIKKELFIQAWSRMYGYGTPDSMIQWIAGADGGKVDKIDPKTLMVQAQIDDFKADVLNVIPPQKAGAIAAAAGLTDRNGWCLVNQKTFESTLHTGVYVIGDSCVAGIMPKSAYSANSQAKVAASAIIASLEGREPETPSYVNTCYSIAGHDYGFSVAAVYTFDDDKQVITGKSAITASDASPEMLKREVAYAHSWFNNIVADSWQ